MLARKYSWIAGAGAAGFVGIVACGGGDAGSACGNYVDALNNLATKCGAKDFIDPSLRSGFVADCSALAKAPGASDLATQLNTCVDSLNASSCALSGLSCTIRGSLTDGSPCASGAQCTGGVCTVAQPSTTSDISCGTCASYGAVGATCSATTPCDPSTGSCVNQKCTAFVPQGGPCANGETCVNGSLCDTASKTCKPPPTKGDACTGSCLAPYKCISQLCADAVAEGGACPVGNECQSSLTCDTNTHTCQTQTLATAGQACGFVNNAFVQCATNLKCTNNVCLVLAPAGAACTPGQGDCASSLSCVNGACALPDYTICNK